MKPLPRPQRGAALLAMLAVLVMGASWWLVTALNTPVNRTALHRSHNAEVLQQAKQALIGWAALQAIKDTEENPGRLPCPEAAANIGNPSFEGTASGNCTLPAVGRLPWRTLGLDKLQDADGEPLWYVVSDGWALRSSAAIMGINSNTRPAQRSSWRRMPSSLPPVASPGLRRARHWHPTLSTTSNARTSPARACIRRWSTTPATRCSTTRRSP
jgi:hypothetical protein